MPSNGGAGQARNVVILGSGPAGLTAAVYAARAKLDPLVLEGPEPGGQLTLTTMVENYPGFVDGVLGPELMNAMREQSRRFGAEVKTEWVVSVDFARRPFTIKTEDGEHRARTVIISTGASAMLLGLDAERRLMGRGVSTCATCDGFFFREKEVAVVGGGDTAMEDALYLTKYATRVNVIHRRDRLRASQVMADRAARNDKIRFVWNTMVEDVLDPEAGKVTAVRIRNMVDERMTDLPVDGLFVAIGHKPNTALFAGQLEMNPNGYLITRPHSTATAVPGVFAAGDVADPRYRQAVTAAGTGCMAAIDAQHFLEANP